MDTVVHMEAKKLNRIIHNPKYQKLVKERRAFAWTLSLAVLVIYYSYILILAFSPETLGQKLMDGSIITVGIPVGVGIIVSAIALTGFYINKSSYFDELTQQIKDEAK